MRIQTKIRLDNTTLVPFIPAIKLSEEQHDQLKQKIVLDIEFIGDNGHIHLQYEAFSTLNIIFQSILKNRHLHLNESWDLYFNDLSKIIFTEQSDQSIRIDYAFTEGIQSTITCSKNDLILQAYDFLISFYEFYALQYHSVYHENELLRLRTERAAFPVNTGAK